MNSKPVKICLRLLAQHVGMPLLCLLGVLSAPTAQPLSPPPVAELQQQARELGLAEHPYWRKLLHFYTPGESVGQWSAESDVITPHFFMSPEGRTNLQAELEATLAGFFEPVGEDPNTHPRCRFVGRYHWLKTHLPLPELPAGTCPLFERWSNLPEAKDMSLVFVSAYLDNPASLYGHLLIKFNSNNRWFGHSLLSPTLNFGAMTSPDDHPLEYALRGLFGGYSAIFSDERFYNFNHVYGESELRDLWEYPLRLTREQRERITRHTWELLQNIRFRYYFFLDNCAYRQAELLEHAWTDETRVNTPGALWVIPVDVVFKVQQLRSESEESLLGEPVLIPSRQRRLQRRAAQLSESGAFWLNQWATDGAAPDNPEFLQLPEGEQAQVLDAFIDWQQYVRDGEFTPEQQSQRRAALRRRSQLPPMGLPEDARPPAPPTQGTPPTRLRVAAAGHEASGATLELGIWSSYRDSLGDPTGHLPDAELTTLDTRVRFNQEDTALSQLTLFRIEKLSTAPAGLPAALHWNWRMYSGWEQRDLGCVKNPEVSWEETLRQHRDDPEADLFLSRAECRTFRLQGGGGLAEAVTERWKVFAFVDLFGQTPRDSWAATTWGTAPHLGMTFSPFNSWHARLEAARYQDFSGPRFVTDRLRLDQRWTLSSRSDLRLEIERWVGTEARLALHWYF